MKLKNQHPLNKKSYNIVDWYTKKVLTIKVITMDADDHDDLDESLEWVLITFYSDTLKCDHQFCMSLDNFFARYKNSKVMNE